MTSEQYSQFGIAASAWHCLHVCVPHFLPTVQRHESVVVLITT